MYGLVVFKRIGRDTSSLSRQQYRSVNIGTSPQVTEKPMEFVTVPPLVQVIVPADPGRYGHENCGFPAMGIPQLSTAVLVDSTDFHYPNRPFRPRILPK